MKNSSPRLEFNKERLIRSNSVSCLCILVDFQPTKLLFLSTGEEPWEYLEQSWFLMYAPIAFSINWLELPSKIPLDFIISFAWASQTLSEINLLKLYAACAHKWLSCPELNWTFSYMLRNQSFVVRLWSALMWLLHPVYSDIDDFSCW